jgi:hypothetical protein
MKHDRGRDARQVCTDLKLELKARVATMERHIRMRWSSGRRRRHGLVASAWCWLALVCTEKEQPARSGLVLELRLYDQVRYLCWEEERSGSSPQLRRGSGLYRMGTCQGARMRLRRLADTILAWLKGASMGRQHVVRVRARARQRG